MSREIKFRAWNENYKQMKEVFGFDLKKERAFLDENLMSWWQFKYCKLMQYTGLKDNTLWNNLTDEEKQKFYNENSSEDGQKIKYQHIEDVKHLWKGKEICEGDITKAYQDKTVAVIKYGVQGEKFVEASFYAEYNGWGQSLSQIELLEVLGNIYEDPGLLKL